MNDQNEQTILGWLKENLTLRGLRPLFLRPPKVERQVVKDSQIDTEVVHAETQEQLPPTTSEPNVLLVTEVPEANVQTNDVHRSKIAHVVITADIPEGMTLNLTIQANAAGKAIVSQSMIPSTRTDAHRTIALPNFKFSQIRLVLSPYFDKLNKLGRKGEWLLAACALLVYLFAITFRLDQFPVYFFGDEAYQVLFAETLIQNHLLAANDKGIPIYIETSGYRWMPLVTTYVHALTMTLFGKSIFVTRLTSALVGLAGIIAISIALKIVFRKQLWWSALLVAFAMPAWMLHGRTAFETVMATGFYGLFILFYLLYRTKSVRYIFPALFFGAASFYSYSNAQAVMGVTALLLLVSDFRYHWENRRLLLGGFVFALFLALPLIIFLIKEPNANAEQLRMVNSYLAQDIPISQKIGLYLQKYLYGLSPQYWFFPNTHDLIRHRMEGMGLIALWMLPFFAFGLWVILKNIRDSAYRTVLLAAVAVPTGGAALEIAITRVLPFIIPATLLIVLGIEWVWDKAKEKIPEWASTTATCILLSLAVLMTLNNAVDQGPFWTNNYGLFGLQYGAKQLFVDTIPNYLKAKPENHIYVSSIWANGSDDFPRFFLSPDDQKRVSMIGVDNFMSEKPSISPNDYFIFTEPEMDKLQQSGWFKEINVDQTIPYPDGTPGFYVINLEYVGNIDEIITAKRRELIEAVKTTIQVEGENIEMSYSPIDMGQPKDLFDDDFFTLMRGAAANPYILDFNFSEPRHLSGIFGQFAKMDYQITADLFPPDSDEPIHYVFTGEKIITDVELEMVFDNAPDLVKRVYIEILQLNPGQEVHVHIREIKFLP